MVFICIENNFCLYLQSEIDVTRHIVCENCAEEVTGGYDTVNNQIIVCQNRVYTEEMTQAVISHELIHMFDYCRAKMDFGDLEHIACSEVSQNNIRNFVILKVCIKCFSDTSCKFSALLDDKLNVYRNN